MDFGTSIIGIIFLLFCIIIFVILSRSNKKKEKELLQVLKKLTDQASCTISRYDVWNHSVIGIDDSSKIIFVISNTNNHSVSLQLNLAEMKKCRVVNASKTGSDDGGNYKVLEKLDLVFTYLDKNRPEILVDFYDRNDSTSSLSDELQLVEKWCRIANDQMINPS